MATGKPVYKTCRTGRYSVITFICGQPTIYFPYSIYKQFIYPFYTKKVRQVNQLYNIYCNTGYKMLANLFEKVRQG